MKEEKNKEEEEEEEDEMPRAYKTLRSMIITLPYMEMWKYYRIESFDKYDKYELLQSYIQRQYLN